MSVSASTPKISWALVGRLKWQRLGKPCTESSYIKHNVIFYPFVLCQFFLNLNKANHCLISLSAALCSTMRALSTKTTGMEMGCTAGPQAISSLASSTSTERKDMDNNCSLMDPAFRLTGWMAAFKDFFILYLSLNSNVPLSSTLRVCTTLTRGLVQVSLVIQMGVRMWVCGLGRAC